MKRPEFKVSVRVTSQDRCAYGFYVLCNGSRIRCATKAKAIEQLQGILDLQRFQIVSVTEYARRKSVKQQTPKAL